MQHGLVRITGPLSGSVSTVGQPLCGIDPKRNETLTTGKLSEVTCLRCLRMLAGVIESQRVEEPA